MATIRDRLDYDFIIPALLRHESYEMIALRESVRLEQTVSRSLIAGLARDIKGGKVRPTETRQADNHFVQTYVFGVEPEIPGALPVFTGHLTLDGSAVVTSDWHSPKIDRRFAESVPKWGKYYGIKRMIIAGDMFDGASQNSFKKKVIPVPFHVEVNVARQLLEYYLNYFEEIWFEPGNHDDWFLQNNNGQITINDLNNLLGLKALEGAFRMTPYDRITLISGGEPWTIPHQAEYSRNALAVGKKLALKFQSNILVPHQHSSADGFDDYWRYRVLDIGGLFDPNLFDYSNLRTSSRPVMIPGFAVVNDGAGTLITPDRRQTDWSKIGD